MFGLFPNIEGVAYGTRVMEPAQPTGAFGIHDYDGSLVGGNTYIGDVLSFDASKFDETYSGFSVQPASLQCLCCIKV